jgi:hypothetical protein
MCSLCLPTWPVPHPLSFTCTRSCSLVVVRTHLGPFAATSRTHPPALPLMLLLLPQLLLQLRSRFSRCRRYRLAYVRPPTPAADAAVAATRLRFLLPPLAPRVSAPPSMLVLLLLLQLQLCGCISCCRHCRCISRCHRCCIISRCRRYHCAYVRLSSVCDPLSVKSIISILTMIRAYLFI